MNNEFVPYKESLELKELGFDEPCFGFYIENSVWTPASYSREGIIYPSNKDLLPGWVSSPTFSQAFRWFREKHGLVFNLVGSGPYYPSIALTYMDGDSDIELYEFDTYEEAELVCLKKLIEIVKQKNMSKIPTAEEYAHLEYLKEDMLDMGLKNMDDLLNKQKKDSDDLIDDWMTALD